MRTSISLLAFSLLLPFLLINPAITSTLSSISPTLHHRIPSNVDVFDKIFKSGGRSSIPALYVFGDSLVDAGNNNFLETKARANYKPYGSTFFPNPTGRFTDGRTTADFIAQFNGLPYAPPYLELKKENKRRIPRTGLNFASGAAGILPGTGNATHGECLNLDKQIALFKEATKKLRKQFKNDCGRFSHYLSKSIFYISAGSNDYSGLFSNKLTGLGKNFTQETFSGYLARQLTFRLKKLYTNGARKFLVTNIGGLGCTPIVLNTVKPATPCVDPLNKAVSQYNTILPGALMKLQARLPGSKFVLVDVFKLSMDIEASPEAFQISDTRTSCCIDVFRNGTSPCARGEAPCKDVKSRMFFDFTHPTQTVHYLTMRRCFTDSTICAPLNLSQLIRA